MKILNLHSHSEFSNASCGFKDSTNKLEDLLNYAYDNNHAGIGLTDHESVSGHFRAVEWMENKISSAATDEEKAKAENFNLVLGNEIYIAREGLNAENHQKDERFYHFILLALDKRGQEQLRELSSLAWEKSYMKSVMRRFNYVSELKKIIGEEQGHVVATTACIANIAGDAFLNNPKDKAEVIVDQYVKMLVDIFGEGNIFIELSPALYTEQTEYNKFMYNRYKDKMPFIITNDVHYLRKEDFRTLEILLGAGREVDMYYKYSHFMTWEEIVKNMSYLPIAFLESAAKSALDIGDRSERYSLKKPVKIPIVPYDEEIKIEELRPDIEKYEYLNKFINSEFEADRVMASKAFAGYLEKAENFLSREAVFERMNLEWGELWGISERLEVRLSDYLLTMSWIIERMWETGTIIGPGRGSAVAFITNYYLGITDLNPLSYGVHIPHWRFISASRPELPDIDIDSPGSDREKILDYLSAKFKELGGEVVQVQTYGTETSRKAIRTVGKGLGMADETISYISSLVPSERGSQLTLSQCYYGDEDHSPVKQFVEQMDENTELWEHAQKIEGLITLMGVHPAGLILSNHPIHENSSIMKNKKGALVTGNNLHESEQMGLIKYDILSIDISKIRTALYLLLQNDKIEWKGSLKETYKHYLSPRNLKPTDETWKAIANNEVNSLFQLNTAVGQAAVRLLHVESIEEIGMINSLMRLQPQSKQEKQPLQIFAEHREDIDKWYNEMKRHGLNEEEIGLMKKHLGSLYGVADTQESIMLLSMDENISGFTVEEANKLRKAVAKKSIKAQEEVKELFYSKGAKQGTRTQLLDYVWGVQIRYSLGYSFSLPHVAAYSYIALQQAILYTQYPSIYWNTACLIEDAGAFSEEDFPELIEKGYLEVSDEFYEIMEAEDLDDLKIKTTPIDRDKIATAIAIFQKTSTILPPDINESGFGFTMNEEKETIRSGLKIVSKLGNKFIYQIIKSRPYASFEEFLDNVKVPRDRVIMLIKAGAFNNISEMNQMELLKYYVDMLSSPKTTLNGRNIQMLIRMNLLPVELDFEVRNFNWWKYTKAFDKVRKGYAQLDDASMRFYSQYYDDSKIEYFNNGSFISLTYGKSLVDKTNEKIKKYIKENHDDLLKKVNQELYNEMWEKYEMHSIEEGEMQSTRMYNNKHPLTKYGMSYDSIEDMEEDNFVGEFNIQGKRFPKYHIYRTIGTVIAKDKLKNTITLLTPEGAIVVKLWKDVFTAFDRKVTTVVDGVQTIIQGSFFEVGTHLVVFGKYQDGMIFPKIYKDTRVPDVMFKINTDGDIPQLEEKINEVGTD